MEPNKTRDQLHFFFSSCSDQPSLLCLGLSAPEERRAALHRGFVVQAPPERTLFCTAQRSALDNAATCGTDFRCEYYSIILYCRRVHVGPNSHGPPTGQTDRHFALSHDGTSCRPACNRGRTPNHGRRMTLWPSWMRMLLQSRLTIRVGGDRKVKRYVFKGSDCILFFSTSAEQEAVIKKLKDSNEHSNFIFRGLMLVMMALVGVL